MLQTPFVLNDPKTGEPRVRVESLLRRGRSADLLVGQTLTPPLVRCVVKVPTCESADPAAIQARLDTVETEYDAMQAVSPWVIMPVGLYEHEVRVDALERTFRVPIIAWRHVEGRTLDEVLAESPAGLEPERALRLAHQLAQALFALHELGFVLRALAPEHVLVTADDEVRLLGFGNAGRREERVTTGRGSLDERYSAPELWGELSGRFVVPRADVYSFGALLAFACTGEHPTGRSEAPLTRRAHERLADLPDGIALLIAHCMQPIGKKRFASMRRLIDRLTLETLPGARDPDFATIALVAPFGRRAIETAPVGRLSAGPLVDRPRDVPEAAPVDPGSPEPVHESTAAASDAPAVYAPHAAPPAAVRVVAFAVAALAALAMAALLWSAARGG